MEGSATAAAAAAPHHPPINHHASTTGTVLRPVVFVIDATNPSPRDAHHPHPHHRASSTDDDGDEPFDVRRTSLVAAGSEEDSSEQHQNLYETFLTALQGKLPGSGSGEGGSTSGGNYLDEELSLAASFASSSAPMTPGEEMEVSSPTTSSSTPGKRFMSPFSRLRVGRWKASSPVGSSSAASPSLDDDLTSATTATGSSTTVHHALAHDMENDPDDTHDDDGTNTLHSHSSDNVSSALSSYSKDNPPVHFMSKRARIVSVSRRHAFPPSKFPKGKMDPMAAGVGGAAAGIGTTTMLGEQPSSHGGNSWMQSYEIQNEGILPSGWLEKHARALPSALVVVTSFKISNDDARRLSIQNATRAVEDLRMTLAEKRSAPIHLVCLLKETELGKEVRLRNLNAMKEKICQECYLPQSQVFLIKCMTDLEPDEFESSIMSSPYREGAVVNQQQGQQQPVTPGAASPVTTVMMNPLLRQLDRSLRDTSALYYSRLAEAQERKLILWRNRYHATNASFEVNTLMAAMRCARYAMKVGTLREFQMRAGGNSIAGGGRWTDKNSSAMRHYDEAYRWIVELHRRSIAWRANALSSTTTSGGGGGGGMTFPSPAPITPGGAVGKLYSMDDIASPKFSESPGGGIGVELSLPGGAPPAPSLSGATPPPPPPAIPLMRRNSPALTSKSGYNTAENVAFFASLWEQCRAVASILNAKLLRSTSSANSGGGSSFGAELEQQWSRHCIIFLSIPLGIPGFASTHNDDFFGPAWHRFLYATEEFLTFACIAEGRWRRAIAAHAAATAKGAPSTVALSPSYHQAGAPWKAYGELCETVLGLRKVIKKQQSGGNSNEWLTSSSAFLSGRRKFVGSIVSGGSGFGTMGWRFESESKKDHRAMALDYVLHALDLLDENLSICGSGNPAAPIQPNSSARLHYCAARLLMTLNNPAGALVHLNIASTQTKTWPSLHLSIQRALFACEERCAVTGAPTGQEISTSNAGTSKDSCIELLLRTESCKLLSQDEKVNAQMKAWKHDTGISTPTREIVWNHDDECKSNPPFEFAVSFLKSTHATSSDSVMACISIKSCLDFAVCVESMQLVTTSGKFDVSNLERCTADKEVLQSWLHKEYIGDSSLTSRYVPNRGIKFNSNDLAFCMTELSLPSNLSDIALGGASADTSKFIPKNGRLCNMGFSHAAGNISESRFDNDSQEKITMNGKPIAISSISEPSSLFLGGIPLVCHGVILNLKQAGGDAGSTLKLHIERPRLISPLLRSGTQQLIMEESNYTVHSWSRPAHHPWCLGPRVLRVLGPRPHMQVTNLTEPMTDCKAVEGTVNRILLKLEAGSDEDCSDVSVRLKCKSWKKSQVNDSTSNDATLEGESIGVEPHQMPTFVQKSSDPLAKVVPENGIALPDGWEPRRDVGTDESHDVTSTISACLEAGKSILYPLDVYRPMDNSTVSSNSENNVCSTSYEVIIAYRQIRAGKGKSKSQELGDQVTVMHTGTIEWISPFTTEFALTNGPKKPFPCGVQHPSNVVPSQSSSIESQSSSVSTELIAADGERVHMRCSLQAKALGSNNITASVLRVTNENDTNELYSSDSGLFMNQKKKGSKLSLSYSVCARRNEGSGKGHDVIPLGVICVNWKPVSLPLPEGTVMPADTTDEFRSAHGPLDLPNLSPVIFYGPQCRVLPSPFSAKLLKCPSTPKVGSPFYISYQVANQTAKSQTLIVSMNDVQEGEATISSCPQLIGTGKLKWRNLELQPFEEKTFSFTFMSMKAGKVLRPPLTVSSGRHQTWIINETVTPQYLFVMP